MENKPLVIDVIQGASPNGSVNTWNVLANINDFISAISTPSLSENADYGAIVSGFPTAFARVDLFKAAFDAATAKNASEADKNLAKYYEELVSEWRGFVACLALDYANIRAKRIDLVYSDGLGIEETANVYEAAGAFGNMLLERRARWCEQGKSDNDHKQPYLNLIKYRGKVVGATSPESLLFTSSNYILDFNERLPWVNIDTKKFIDPLNSDLKESDVLTLMAYVRHILAKLPEMENHYPKELKVEYSGIRFNLERWIQEIEDYASRHNYGIHKGSVPAVDLGFFGPFANLFCHQDTLYGVEGRITESPQGDEALRFDPRTLLLPSDAKIVRIQLSEFKNNPEKLNELPVFVLKALKKGTEDEYAYFSLPLSAKGLNVYGKAIGPLVGVAPDGARVDSTLTAVFDPAAAEDNLDVKLSIRTENGTMREYTQHYTVDNSKILKNKDILLWPNFVSRQWNNYYLYSELPHNNNSQSYNAIPFVGDPSDGYFRIMTDKNDQPILLADKGEIVADTSKVKAELLVMSGNTVAENPYKYEIYRSDKPFKGVKLVAPTGEDGGYLIVNYSTDRHSRLPHNLLASNDRTLQEVTLGVDFGSTNTSVAYSTENGIPEGFEFTNQRVSLFGMDHGAENDSLKENRILFFQGREKPLASNALHSILTLHDERRLGPLKEGKSHIMRMSQEVVGGFPCFMDNLPVQNVDPEFITLKYPQIGAITQVHNMKWSNPQLDIAHKKAFLRTLLLQIYAEMFNKDKVPTALRWSFPSSMSNFLLSQYQQIWDELKTLRPVNNIEGQPYNLEISQYKGTLNFMDVEGFGDDSGAFSGGIDGMTAFSPIESNIFGSPGAAPETAAPAGFESNAPEGFGNFGGGFGDPFANTQPAPNPTPQAAANGYPDLRPDDPARVISYDPKPLFDKKNSLKNNISLTEANSVANFMSSKYGDQVRVLNLCFDIGGSTTDISALYKLAPGLTMIKQNSIRFAAQRVSGASAYVPKFKDAIVGICNQFGIDILGLTKGADRYTPETAPYYFDQIVDRLSEEQLPAFYKLMSTVCPQLFWVNMYVTGLLLFYAGQVACKLVDDIAHVTPAELLPNTSQRPYVRVTFAGKGSRLLQWLSTTYPDIAAKYYFQLFVQGYGGQQKIQQTLGQWPRIELPTLDNSGDIKYEVSKGLAKNNTDLCNPKDDTPSEIIGEAGFTLVSQMGQAQPVADTNSITPEMVEWIGTLFNPNHNDPCSKFKEFCGTFYTSAQQLFDMRIPQEVFVNGFRNMNIVQYVQNCPEYIQAQREKSHNNNKFDFVAPIIILEGMKFYDDYLIRNLK